MKVARVFDGMELKPQNAADNKFLEKLIVYAYGDGHHPLNKKRVISELRKRKRRIASVIILKASVVDYWK